jgi:hypothetical protein
MIKYTVKAKIIKGKIDNQTIFETFDKEFVNDLPIIARNEAIEYYQDILEMLKNSSSDEEEFKSKMIDEDSYYEFESSNYRFRKHQESGLALYVNFNDENLLLLAEGDFSIDEWDSIFFNLKGEYEFYLQNHFNLNSQETQLTYYCKGEWEDGYTEDEPETTTILKTPADWSGKEEELWWDKERKLAIVKEEPRTWTPDNVIALGEGKFIEFKSALVYNFKTQRGGIGIKYIIAKSICSFLNTGGGFLFIGVSDDKKILGLDPDFSLSQEKDHYDFFKLEFDEMINRFFSSSIHGKIRTEFVSVQEKDVFIVQVEKSDRPIFLKGQEEKEFWIRGEASTRRLIEVADIIDHCFHTWLKKD